MTDNVPGAFLLQNLTDELAGVPKDEVVPDIPKAPGFAA